MKILIIGDCLNINNLMSVYFKSDILIFLENSDALNDRSYADNVITRLNPDIVFYFNTIENIDYCEKNEEHAYKYNVICPMNTAIVCNKLSIPILYPSSAHIFDGYKKRPYTENDDCNPLNIYGKTKLYAEQLIKTITNKYYIIRTSLIFGMQNETLNEIIATNKYPVVICEKQIISPIYSDDFCNTIMLLIKSDKYGVYNLSDGSAESKYEFIKKIYTALNLGKDVMEFPLNLIQNKAKRAEYTALDNMLITKTLNNIIPSYEKRITDYICSIS